MTTISTVQRPSYAHKPRVVWPPSLIIIHATRGHTSNALQDDATVSWFAGAPDRGGWTSTADCLVSADEDRCYVFEPHGVSDLRDWRSSWSAGYGSIGPSSEWGADEVAISIEIAQSDQLEPFADATVQRVAWLCAELQRQLAFSVAPTRVPSWSQLRNEPIPNGYIGHEDLANGRKLGKTDPGRQWPWDRFLAYMSADLANAPTPQQRELLEYLASDAGRRLSASQRRPLLAMVGLEESDVAAPQPGAQPTPRPTLPPVPATPPETTAGLNALLGHIDDARKSLDAAEAEARRLLDL